MTGKRKANDSPSTMLKQQVMGVIPDAQFTEPVVGQIHAFVKQLNGNQVRFLAQIPQLTAINPGFSGLRITFNL